MWNPAEPGNPWDNYAVDSWDPNSGVGGSGGGGGKEMYGIDSWNPLGQSYTGPLPPMPDMGRWGFQPPDLTGINDIIRRSGMGGGGGWGGQMDWGRGQQDRGGYGSGGGRDQMYGMDQRDGFGDQRRRRDLYGVDAWDANHRTLDPLPGGVDVLRGGGFGSLFGRQGPYGWR